MSEGIFNLVSSSWQCAKSQFLNFSPLVQKLRKIYFEIFLRVCRTKLKMPSEIKSSLTPRGKSNQVDF